MIVTVLGGSAASTPALIDWLARAQPSRPITLRLAGRNPGHLAAVTHACKVLSRDSNLTIESFPQSAWDQSVTDADVVLIQVRVGGLEGREFDEWFPLQYDVPGDEGLGPGGLSAALRSWPVIRRMLQQVRQSAPSCLVVLLTSPGSLLARLGWREFPDLRVHSICELPFTTLGEVCRVSSVPLDGVHFSYAGVNHLGWLYDISAEGMNLVEAYCACEHKIGFRRVIEHYGAVPLKYLRLHFDRSAVLEEQQRCAVEDSRARQLAAIRQNSLLAFGSGSILATRLALLSRATPWYAQAVGPLLLNLSGNTNGQSVFFISAADPDGEVCERPYKLRGRTFERIPVNEPPPPVHELNLAFTAYEREAALSLQEPSIKKLSDALLAHPWVTARRTANGLAETMWHYFRDFRENEPSCLN